MDAKKGDWVLIHNIVLNPKERAPQVPDDTKEVPLEMWVKGFINHDALIDSEVEITTMTGRIVRGRLIDVNPYYKHNYGKCVPELLKIGLQLREIVFGGEDRE
ncbi:2-amino-4-oxopentanoate thiolase subunit OrtA [Tepidibacter thalassicus]|uniref:2-amino-4-ketopentanoate thiolase alpha subunit n=1 Tax=Tepidibacter thalassicus DSM 15285 TaxID=1123350 RepID=A0A1M5QIR4_9FIRM|nr:2-amino-4-oxopentanoate thiolase subunit OrtA [Tepidibacter thalassicus]SHH13771.1 hypothetical protein SAMN02744040_00965 [Tepidibacter thalassicus DSM 15285]